MVGVGVSDGGCVVVGVAVSDGGCVAVGVGVSTVVVGYGSPLVRRWIRRAASSRGAIHVSRLFLTHLRLAFTGRGGV